MLRGPLLQVVPANETVPRSSIRLLSSSRLSLIIKPSGIIQRAVGLLSPSDFDDCLFKRTELVS